MFKQTIIFMANAEHEEQPCCIILDYSYRQNMEMGVPKINRIHTGDTGVSKWLNIYVQKTTPVGYNESVDRVKTWLWSRVEEERLNGLCLMYIHRDIKINVDEVINRFAKQTED